MRRRLCVAVAIASALGSLATGATTASAAKRCGTVARPFTDGGAVVVIRKGDLRCATARGLLRAYWRTEVAAFRSVVRLRHAGIRWTCRPTVGDFPFRWECRGGGRARDRFRVTARE